MPLIRNSETKVETIAVGFEFAEGPVWHPDGFLLFSDTSADTIYRWLPEGKIEIFRCPAGYPNGNTWDRQGRLVTAQHDRRLTRTEPDGMVVTLASHYEGKKLNSPNDVLVKSDGSIYFTDPPYGILEGSAVEPQPEELGFYGVYHLADDGTLTLLIADLMRPNGLVFTPDEQKLYVSDSQEGNVWVFEVRPDGTVTNGSIFADLKLPDQEPLADGLAVDSQGNLYATGPEGIWIFSPAGELLDKILLPENCSNVAWGDSDYKTLYITTYSSLYRIRLNIPGLPVWPMAN
ncbi:SMP-30/gluconolactonase/LRE family protein [Leptolyngbya sp. FACHB-261]|uniref:SMP-30/gluconolactonase/LRE family protein n=1 Tax=Leptolyngbya sp. FACHB-261 TaxID=2692806 RepID=UPI001687E5F6|nr:SMP-30/gluconolactonase/LRE family protein [Leptolyngbya sp. FACHB-261]MBD2103123.1 SMP-30/gluconolactonase/LRE family protein [Leptolyngbya sp. FACHB-261]